MTPAPPAAFAPPLRGILFDFGGTLDGDGLHWLDRFYELYARLGMETPRAEIRAAFDFAEREMQCDDSMRQANLQTMLERHVGWQFDHLGRDDRALQQKCVAGFVAGVRAVAVNNAAMLAKLAGDGLRLGVISNGCGNTAVLCDELGYSMHLAVVLDSSVVGLSKPDPAFFRQALASLQLSPAEVLMVGDSLERDIEPARLLGLRTAWLTNTMASGSADFHLTALHQLPAALAALSAR